MNVLERPPKLLHAGLPAVQRINSILTKSGGVCIRIPQGESLLKAITQALHDMGTDSGFAEIYGGELSPANYCIPAESDGEGRAVSFSDSKALRRTELISASATIGIRDGAPYMHCHGHFLTTKGKHVGGHLFPETYAGINGPWAAVYGLSNVQWVSADDPETNMPVFTPREVQGNTMDESSGMNNTVIARVLPNEDITESVLRMCAEQGFSTAVIRAGLGSLIGASYKDRETGQRRQIDGPGTEVTSLTGHVSTTNGIAETHLTCTLVDRHGQIHAGELIPGMNPVAVTFELVIQQISNNQNTN